MTTLVAEKEGVNLNLKLLILLAIIVAAISLVFSHAERKHGDIEIVRRYCETNLFLSFKIEDEDKIVQFCELPGNETGVRVIKKIKGVWNEITAYRIAKEIADVILNENLDRFDEITYASEKALRLIEKFNLNFLLRR